MPITFKIRPTGASPTGYVDYSSYVWSATEGDIAVKTHQINQLQKLEITLLEAEGFSPPQRGNHCILNTASYGDIFNGFIAADPEKVFYGSKGDNVPRYQWKLTLYSEELILDLAAPRYFYTITPIQNKTVGQIITYLIDLLEPTGWFDTSGIDNGPTIPFFKIDPTKSFMETVQALANQSSMHFWTKGGSAFLKLYGDVNIALVSDTASTWNPDDLNINPDAVPIYNDVIGLGDIEPQTYIREYFAGDGLTPTFALSILPYGLENQDLIDDPFSQGAINTQTWSVVDPTNSFMGGPSLFISGGQGIGRSEIVANLGLELGGTLVAQHGTFRFTAASSGIVGGMYTTAGPTGHNYSNLVLGYGFSAAGGQTQITPLVFGSQAPSSTTLTTQSGYDYVLQTIIHTQQYHRFIAAFSSINTPTGFGGLPVSANGHVTFRVLQISESDPTAAPTAFQLFTGEVSGLPEFVTYGLINAANINCAVNFCDVGIPVDAAAVLYPSAVGQSPTTLVLGLKEQFFCDASIIAGQQTATPAQLSYFGANAAPLGSILEVRYRQAGQAISRIINPSSIADEAARSGDSGVRAGVLTADNFQNPPRNATDLDFAIKAFMDDHQGSFYTGKFVVESMKTILAQEPTPGWVITVNASTEFPQFLGFIKEVVTHVVVDSPSPAGLEVLMHDLNFGYITRISTLANEMLRSPYVAVANLPTVQPPPIDFFYVGVQYAPDIPYMRWNPWVKTPNTYEIDQGQAAPSGGNFEIRYWNYYKNWGSGSGLDLIETTALEVNELPRNNNHQIYYAKAIAPSSSQYPSSTQSRYASLARLNLPLIPPAITGVTVDSQSPYSITFTMDIDQSPSAINMFGVSVRASGPPASGGAELYSFGYPSLFFSPDDPGLQFTWNASTAPPGATEFTFQIYTWNTLGELSLPFYYSVELTPSGTIGASAVDDCLNVVRFGGAVANGIHDDTANVQKCLDQAHLNYIAIQTSTPNWPLSNPTGYGPTIVCIDSGQYCLVTPTWDDQRDRSGGPDARSVVIYHGQPFYSSVRFAGDTLVTGQHGVGYAVWGASYGGTQNPHYPQQDLSSFYPGMSALLIDDGVTLEINGGLILGRSPSAEQFMRNNFYIMAWVLQNKNAFIQGPFGHDDSTPNGPKVTTYHSYQEWISGSTRTAPEEDAFTQSGSATTFTLSQTPTPCSVSTDTGIGFTVSGNTIHFVSPPPTGVFHVDYIFQDPGFELGPRNKNILITGSGFIDCGSYAYRTWPTTTLPAYVGCNGICFSKCDQSEINNINIKAFSPAAIYWGHSEQAKMQNLRLTDGSGFENAPDHTPITCDVLRKSAVFQNFGTQLPSFISLHLCHSVSVTHNKLQRSGSTQYNMVTTFTWSVQYGWVLQEDFSSDTDITLNEFTYNRAPAWEPGKFYEGYDSVIVPSACYTNPIAPGPAGYWDWYVQYVPTYDPAETGSLSSWVAGNSGFSGPSEPAFNNASPQTVVEPIISVVGDFLGNGGDVNPDGTPSKVFLSFLGDINDAHLVVKVNGVPTTAYTFHNASIQFNSALTSSDVVTADYTANFAWSPPGGGQTGDQRGPSFLTAIADFRENGDTGYRLKGLKFEHNIVTDNDMDAVHFQQLAYSSISYNLVERNSSGIIEWDCGGYNDNPFHMTTIKTQIVHNTVSFYPNYADDSLGVIICSQDSGSITVDNPNVNPSSIIRGGISQNFFNQVMGEIPSGTINGVNTHFNLKHSPQPSSLQLYEDGKRTIAFSLAGSALTMTTPPVSTLIADYQW